MLKRTIAARAAVTTAAVLGLTFAVAACAPSAPSVEPSAEAEPTHAPETLRATEPETVRVPDGLYYALYDNHDDPDSPLSRLGRYETWTFDGSTIVVDEFECAAKSGSEIGEVVNDQVQWEDDYVDSPRIMLNEDGTAHVESEGYYALTLFPDGAPEAEDLKARVETHSECAG